MKNTIFHPSTFKMMILCLAASLAFAAGPDMTTQAQTELTPQEMSSIWRIALEGAFQGQEELSPQQDALLWQAMAFGSPEAFANKAKAPVFANFAEQMEQNLPGASFISSMKQMRPMFDWLENAGYSIPFCVCSTTNTAGNCITPCVGISGGIRCIPWSPAQGQTNDGMCFTSSPF